MSYKTIIPLIFALFAAPSLAHCWGPATHLELSTSILSHLHLLPEAIASLLRTHPLDFYYGSIAADIVVAKKMAHYLHHCHRWTVGLEVLDTAEKPSQEAFAWGYLTHLSADVVAHNYFVPYKTILGFSKRSKNHAYWEVKFDSYADEEVWDIVQSVSDQMHLDNDELLKKVLSRQLFSFQTNKAVFNGVVLLGRSKKWQAIVNKSKEEKLDPRRVSIYKNLSLNAALSLLCQKEEAWCFRADPTGEQSLKAASIIAGNLRELSRKRALSDERFMKILTHYRPHLEASIYGKANADLLLCEAREIIEADSH